MHPEHISAYSLIVEDGTPLSGNTELLDRLPSEEEDRKQYARTKMLLERAGYRRYEISNYAVTGYECRHNLCYWTGGEYLGVGLNAASYLKLTGTSLGLGGQAPLPVRFKGVDNLDEYVGRFSRYGTGYTDITSSGELINSYYTDISVLKPKDEMEEFMFLGLRCIKGISRMNFAERFGKDSVIAMATVDNGKPDVRFVNAYYEDGSFYIITYALSNKMKHIKKDPIAAIAGEWFTAHGIGYNLGYFGNQENALDGTIRADAYIWENNQLFTVTGVEDG